MWESRVLRRAFERLELHEGKLSRAVLRGGGGGDVTSLPDDLGGQPPRSTRPEVFLISNDDLVVSPDRGNGTDRGAIAAQIPGSIPPGSIETSGRWRPWMLYCALLAGQLVARAFRIVSRARILRVDRLPGHRSGAAPWRRWRSRNARGAVPGILTERPGRRRPWLPVTSPGSPAARCGARPSVARRPSWAGRRR